MARNDIQMARHAALETTDAKRQEEDWKENIEIGPTYEHLRPQVVDLLSNLTDILDGHMGTIRTEAPHRPIRGEAR